MVFILLREFWGWFWGWKSKPKKAKTMHQLFCNGCGEVTWHRCKLHDHVCNTCDTSRSIEGSDKRINVDVR